MNSKALAVAKENFKGLIKERHLKKEKLSMEEYFIIGCILANIHISDSIEFESKSIYRWFSNNDILPIRKSNKKYIIKKIEE